MPSTLTPGAKAVWKRLAPVARRMGVLTVADRDAFAILCEAAAMHSLALRQWVNGGKHIILISERGSKKNPLLEVVHQAAERYKIYAAHFGLTPSSRSEIRLSQSEIRAPVGRSEQRGSDILSS